MTEETYRSEVSLKVKPWFYDHFFDGRAVFPAVETMQLLAGEVLNRYPDFPVQNMRDALFSRFLPLPEGVTEIPVVVELDELGACSATEVRARLLSRKKLKAMTRLVEHGSITFCRNPELSTTLPGVDGDKAVAIDAAHIYRVMVPFGPAYQTITGTLCCNGVGASCSLQPGLFADKESKIQQILGSPFTLDGAFHAACVLGQQRVSYIPFPVGFASRTVLVPTQPGERYTANVVCTTQSTAQDADELLFDLEIRDAGQGQGLCEVVRGIRMRDVTGGRIRKAE